MPYKRPKNSNPMLKSEKLNLLKEYNEFYRNLAVIDPSSLNRKISREAFAEVLDRIGEILINESARLAKSDVVKSFLDSNSPPPSMAKILPYDFRCFCLLINALKQWVTAEQSATDRYLFGGNVREICRQAVTNCLVTGEILGKASELHHPVRDGRPPILISEDGHDKLEKQTPSTSGDPRMVTLIALRKRKKSSWVSLQRGCLALLNERSPSKATDRSFARYVHKESKFSPAEILEILKNEME